MKVTSSASTRSGQSLSIELDEADVPGLTPQMSAHQKHQKMMIEADTMVVRYLLESEQVSREYADARLQEIGTRSSRVPL